MTHRNNVILGGAGMIGRALQIELERIGERTVILDIKNGFDLRERQPEVYEEDAYYWFLAWDVGGAKYIMNPGRQIDILRNNLRLCEKVFGFLEARSSPFTFVSTQMVGYPNAYGATKHVGEIWTNNLAGGITARLWNVYGAEPVDERTHLIPDMICQGSRGTIRLQTSGRERRQFIHCRDCAEGLIRHRASGMRLADLTSCHWVSVYEVAKMTADALGASIEAGTEDGYESLIEPKHLLPGWLPAISLKDGINDIVYQMRKQAWI
jgi:nucleoside-diphosphate-sugar epimerase